MPLPLSIGMTYMDVQCERHELYIAQGPGLLRRIMALLNNIDEQDDLAYAVDQLNVLSLDLASLDPRWNAFSIACFNAQMLKLFFTDTRVQTSKLKKAFQICADAVSSERRNPAN